MQGRGWKKNTPLKKIRPENPERYVLQKITRQKKNTVKSGLGTDAGFLVTENGLPAGETTSSRQTSTNNNINSSRRERNSRELSPAGEQSPTEGVGAVRHSPVCGGGGLTSARAEGGKKRMSKGMAGATPIQHPLVPKTSESLNSERRNDADQNHTNP